ncbi:hypothetical protein BDN67DRAFT_875818, partial [Paxillus ammoniavirescens]
GHPHILSQADLIFLQALIDHRHTLYLNKLHQELFIKRGVQASISTLAHAVKRLHVTQKVVMAPALEQSEELRALYM